MQQQTTSTDLEPDWILVSGGTGYIGRHLIGRLLATGARIIVYTRSEQKCRALFGTRVRALGSLAELQVDTHLAAIVNLAGLPIMGFPWTRSRRRLLLQSRLATTDALVGLAARLRQPPAVLLSASAIGYYGLHGDELVDERATPTTDFQSILCQQWEQAAMHCESLGTRVTRLRLGVVLGGDGGALPQLLRPARLGLGAILGSGRQWISWIHIEDVVGLFERALRDAAMIGAVNATAPHAVTQEQLQRAIARSLHRPSWLRVPAWPIRLALGELAQLLVDGQRVVPARAIELGYRFQYPDIDSALAQITRHGTLGRSSRNE